MVALEKTVGVAFATGGSEIGAKIVDAHSFPTDAVCIVIR